MKKGLFVKNPGHCSIDFKIEMGVLKEMKAQKASFFFFFFPVWDLCLRHNHLTFCYFPLVRYLIFQELTRTKEQLTEIPPDGNIWKAILRDFKAVSYFCSHRE